MVITINKLTDSKLQLTIEEIAREIDQSISQQHQKENPENIASTAHQQLGANLYLQQKNIND